MSFFTDVRDTFEGQIVNQFTIGIPLPGPGVIVPTGTSIIGQNIGGSIGTWSPTLRRYMTAFERSALDNLSGAAKVAYAASLGLAAVQVGGATAGNVAANVVQGNPLTKNAGLAAGADVIGLAAGAGLAASGFVDAAAGGGAVDLSAGGNALAQEVAETGLVEPVQSAAIDAAATAPGGASTLGQIAGAAKSAIGAAGTVAGLVRLVSPPKPPLRPIAPPRSPAVPSPVTAAAPACNVCGVGRALLAIAPLAAFAFS